jgi:hypothetical protein
MYLPKLADAGFANVDTELEQLAVNPRRSPEWILAADLVNQGADLRRDCGPTRAAVTRLPGPEETKGSTVPCDHGLRPDDDQRRAPIRPNARQSSPEESIRRRHLGSLHGALENSELVTESQDLELER